MSPSRSPQFHRSELLVGPDALDALARTRVILFGLGGVGSWTAEALIRSGIGHLTLVDSDAVCITNVNRQLQATTRNVGRSKVQELAERLRAIHPHAEIVPLHQVYGFETKDDFALSSFDYVLDAIDSLSPKLGLILQALELGRTLFSTMGASSKLDPTRIRVGSIWESRGDPLARRIRKRLRHHDMQHADFRVVYSDEMRVPRGGGEPACGTGRCFCPPFAVGDDGERMEAHEWCSHKVFINGTFVHVTATFGMFLAGLVINDVIARAGAMPVEKGREMPVREEAEEDADEAAQQPYQPSS